MSVDYQEKITEIDSFCEAYLEKYQENKCIAYSRIFKRFMIDMIGVANGVTLEEITKMFDEKNQERKEYKSEHAIRYRNHYAEFLEEQQSEYNKLKNIVNNFFEEKITEESLLILKMELEKTLIYHVYNKYYDNGSLSAFFGSLNNNNNKVAGTNKSKTKKCVEVQKIFVGAPGVGKSYTIDQITKEVPEVNKTRIVFHPDYENHDFVGSILPVVNEGNVTYEFKPGPFTRCLKEANKRKEEMHFLIIEEITRGNSSAIFGEVFQLLDRDETGKSEYPISNEEMARVIYGDDAINNNYEVVIPKNVSILATANTSDQNVYVLDTAFKRRFEFEYLDVEADEEVDLPDINVFGRKWKDIYMSINKYIVDVLEMSEDKQIGPFFIKNQSELSKLCRYLWEDIDKASFLSEKTIFSDKYSNRFSDINKLCNKAIIDDTVTAEIMLSDNFLQFIKGNNEE